MLTQWSSGRGIVMKRLDDRIVCLFVRPTGGHLRQEDAKAIYRAFYQFGSFQKRA